MDRIRVLLVDDEDNIRELMKAYILREGYLVYEARDGEEAIKLQHQVKPHIVVLDLMLPGMDGLEVCRLLRETSDVYIIMVTARGEEGDRILGLNEGADDYLTKPFSPRELVARINALVRRLTNEDETLRFGELEINPLARSAFKGRENIELSSLQFNLLLVLASHKGIVLSRQQIIDKVWGYDWSPDDRLVDVHIGNLRKKIEDDPGNPQYIKTVRGVGYLFWGELK